MYAPLYCHPALNGTESIAKCICLYHVLGAENNTTFWGSVHVYGQSQRSEHKWFVKQHHPFQYPPDKRKKYSQNLVIMYVSIVYHIQVNRFIGTPIIRKSRIFISSSTLKGSFDWVFAGETRSILMRVVFIVQRPVYAVIQP